MDEPLHKPNEPPRRSLIQRLLIGIFPTRWSESMIAESKGWKARCLTCDHQVSIWDLGGVRWKARSSYKRIMIRCPNCRAYRLAAVEWSPDESVSNESAQEDSSHEDSSPDESLSSDENS